MDNPIDILNMEIGGMKVKDMSSMTFIQWVAKKLNGLPAYKASTVELTSLVSNPPMSRLMPDEEKIRIINKMKSLDMPLP